MREKSHVSMEQCICLVCGAVYDTGAILLDRRLRASMKRHTVTGWGLCEEHQRLFDEGYVALIECDPQKSSVYANRLKPDEAHRTGRVAHLKRNVFASVFNVAIKQHQSCVFVEPGVIEKLEAASAGKD